jgi:transposase InsO family protein
VPPSISKLIADTFLWGLAKSRFYALSSPFPLYAYSDHLPLKWVRKCDKGPVSAFTLEQLSDLSWIHTYIPPGPLNTLYDGLSRYPLLGPRVLAPIGITQAVATLLDHLPDSFRDSPKIRVFAPPHTQRIAQQIQAWRRPTNPIDTHSFTHRSPPPDDTSLIISVPPPEDAPRIAARLLSSSIPFALLLPAELAPRIADDNHFPEQPALAHLYAQAKKFTFLDSDQLWFLGNLPTLQLFSKIYAQLLSRPAPLLEHFHTTRDTSLPTTIAEWKNAQLDDPAFLTDISPESLLLSDGLFLFKDPDFPSRILVPPSLRETLVRQHHADLQHLSHPKVLTSLARHYHWPTMKTDVRKFLQNCELCENERAKRRLAHGMFSGHHTDKPRSRYAMDFQGQGKATTGEMEALAIIDSFTKTVFVLALPNREANTLAPCLLDEIFFRRGAPDIIHTDAAPEFLSEIMAALLDATGTTRTTTCGHNAQSNGEIESWWRFWNRSMKFLSPSDYLLWPSFSQRICFSYNSVPHESLAGTFPFEMDYGTPPVSAFAPPDPQTAPPFPDDTFDDSQQGLQPTTLSPALAASAIQVSVAAFHRYARSHREYLQNTTAERLNLQGTPTSFLLGQRVKIYMPPTHNQLERTGRRAKHIVSWRGPCIITHILSPVAYRMKEECSHRVFERTLVNIRPYKATRSPPPPHHDMLSTSPLAPGTIIAIRRNNDPTTPFDLARITTSTETHTHLAYLGTTNPNLRLASFKAVWIDPRDNKTVLKDTRPARNHQPVTGDLSNDDLPDLLVATHLVFTTTGKLTSASYQILHHLADQLSVY